MKLGQPRYNRTKTSGYLLRCDGSFVSWTPEFHHVRDYDVCDDAWREWDEDRATKPSAHINVIHDTPAHRYRCLHCHAHWADTFTGMLTDTYDRAFFAKHFENAVSPMWKYLHGGTIAQEVR